MHGLGNDFVVIDNTAGSVRLKPNQVRGIAHRRYGVGCDQLLLVEPARAPGAQLRLRIFNADGVEVEQCGNGTRCIALFARERGLAGSAEIVLETPGGLVSTRMESDGQITVDMGRPRLEPAEIPFNAQARAPRYALQVKEDVVDIGAVSMGNPHAVLQVDNVDAAPVESLGPFIQRHERFPEGANVGFMEVLAPDQIRLRVYERGAGETLACGTGACAAAVVGQQQALLGETVNVDLPGGRLRIRWDGDDSSVWMTGPAEWVFEGVITV